MLQCRRLSCRTRSGEACSRRSAGEPVDENRAVFAGFLDDGFALDDKALPDVGEVEIVVQRRCAPDAPHLDAPVGEGLLFGEIGRAVLFEMQANIVHETWLIVFGREVIVRPTPDDVGGQCALGQQRVASDVAPGDITSSQQRHGHADFVGLLVLIAACYGEGADFFWAWHWREL